MPIRIDGERRWVEMQLVVPGAPEDVWRAMATGPGNAAWFTRASIEEKVGGALRFEFGAGMSSSGEVTVWQPPSAFGYVERDWAENAPPIATEITITPRKNGACLVRMVHSLISSSDAWDDQMEGFENGWPGYFEVLRIYLGYFANEPAAPFQVMGQVAGDSATVWSRMTQYLGVAGANVGDVRTIAGPQNLSGIVERVEQGQVTRLLTLRLDDPCPGVALLGSYEMGGSVNVSISVFFYGADAQGIAVDSEQAWQNWFASELPGFGAA